MSGSSSGSLTGAGGLLDGGVSFSTGSEVIMLLFRLSGLLFGGCCDDCLVYGLFDTFFTLCWCFLWLFGHYWGSSTGFWP